MAWSGRWKDKVEWLAASMLMRQTGQRQLCRRRFSRFRSIVWRDVRELKISANSKNETEHTQYLVVRRGVGVQSQAERIVIIL